MKIIGDFNMSNNSLRALRFAAALAGMLDTSFLLRTPPGYRKEDFVPVLREQIGLNPEKFDVYSGATIHPLPDREEEYIYVTNSPLVTARTHVPSGTHILCTHGEDGTRTFKSALRLALPFGDGESALQAMKIALQLLHKAKRGKASAFHTTYPNPEVESNDAQDHLTENALHIKCTLMKMARDANIELDVEVAMADDVSNYVLEAAPKADCDMIVISEGGDDSLGDGYADQIEAQSHLPVLVIAKKVQS